MQTLRTWIVHAWQHPVTTFVGALPTIYLVIEWVSGHPGATPAQMVLNLAMLVLGAAMRDPGK